MAEVDAKSAWVCFTDGWRWWAPGREGRSQDPPTGHPLGAELVESDSLSYQLRQDGHTWLWTRMEEVESDDPDRFEDRSYVSTEGPRMRYRCYWRAVQRPPVPELRPYAARFLGWEEDRA